MAEFSIIIPVYMVEEYITQCLDSVINQTYGDFEVLITDDCGTDNSIKIAENYAKKDKRIKILKHKENLGLSAARNTALKKAKGKYIVCLDSDDWLEPNCLQILKSEFELRKTESIWFNAKVYNDITHKYDAEYIYEPYEGYQTVTYDNINQFSDFSWIKAYTRDSIQKYNLEWPQGLTFEDGEFYFKYFTLNPKTYVISDRLINYRQRKGSIVYEARIGNVKMEDLYCVIKNLKNFWEKLGLYEQYKTALLKLVNNRLKMCKNLNFSDKNIALSERLLKEIGYPEEFSVFSDYKESEETPLFTVVVPFYNVGNYIGQCLDSIISQTYKNLEIICVDDASPDNSFSIVSEYAKKDKRIKIIRHEKNKKLGGARNTGLRNANGKYILFVDSDDRIFPECVSEVIKKFNETHLNTVWFKSKVWWENTNRMTDMYFYSYFDKHKEGKFTIDDNNLMSFPFCSWNKAYKREFLLKNKLFWRENIYFEDVEFYFKLLTQSPEVYIIDKPFYIYTKRNDSIMSMSIRNKHIAKDLYKVAYNVYSYFQKNHLLHKYQNSFNKYIYDVIFMYRSFPELDEMLNEEKYKLLCKIGR